MVILFPPGGRTGNQLFQAAYIASLAGPKGYFFTRGFGKTRALLYGSWKRRWLNIDAKPLCWIIERVVEPLCWHLLIKTGLVSSIIELRGETLDVRKGKIRRVTIVKGFFETDSFMAGDIRRSFRLKHRYIVSTRGCFAQMRDGAAPLFVHIRHSDFGATFVEGHNIQLPDVYYKEGVEVLKRKYSDPFFVIVGDDPAYAEKLFADLPRKYVSRLSPADDLALMSQCAGGVLSNSTFAWWGAFMGKPGGTYVAPRFWWGWPIGKWQPAGMDTALVSDYIDVKALRQSRISPAERAGDTAPR